MTTKELLDILGGKEAVDKRVRELSMPIAEKENMDVDEWLDEVICRSPFETETTRRELYRLQWLEGYLESFEYFGVRYN